MEKLIEISKYFNISVDELLDEENNKVKLVEVVGEEKTLELRDDASIYTIVDKDDKQYLTTFNVLWSESGNLKHKTGGLL
mgnify:CR=1 FL=1